MVANPLAQAHKRTKTTDKGVDLVERIAKQAEENLEFPDNNAKQAFIQVRLAGIRPKKLTNLYVHAVGRNR